MVAPGTTTLLLSKVEKWRTSALSDFATALATANNDTFRTNIDNTKRFFTEAGNSWQGAAYDAAYDRIGEDHTQASKVWAYVDDLVTEVNAAASTVESYRNVLLGKVNEARAAGLTVADNWVVAEKEGVSASTLQSHQDAINSALWPFFDAVATACTKISEAAEFVRIAGDLFGSDIDVADTKSQGGRIGSEDGRAVADAARNHDTAKLDEIASHLPTYALTPDQIQALSNGQDVPTMPAELQDYYKEFFAGAGKDGLLALNDRLDAQASSGSPTSAAAVTQQRALADGMMAITNEHLGTGRGPDGKLTSAGSYTNLPPDIRQLVSGREQEHDPSKGSSPEALRQRFEDRARFADLLSKADPDMSGGRTFSTEIARQGASMAQYIEGADKTSNGAMPPGFRDGDHDKIKDASAKLLSAGTRNHEASYQLLTGRDPYTGNAIPDDLSFGAQGNEYAATGDYDAKKFTNFVFGHDWGDQGKLPATLFDWTADHTHDQGAEGDLARKTIGALPDVFAPKNGDRLLTTESGTTVFQQSADAFNKNPELANSLARVAASNIDAFSGVATSAHAAPPAVPLELKDSERLLFLASQTNEGRVTLDLARQTYDNAALYQLTHGAGSDPTAADDIIKKIAGLDAHIDDAGRNAIIYQHNNDVAAQNEQAQHAHDDRQKIGNTVKGLVDNIPVPGGAAVNTVKGLAEDPLYDAFMEGINPDPTPAKVQYPDKEAAWRFGDSKFGDHLDEAIARSEQPPSSQQRVDIVNTYERVYNDIVAANLVTNNNDLDQLATGGAQAPNSSEGTK
ncbi:hypothetical protein ACFYTQ_12310 [Nocardia sp. NPDC004068]|uniref:TPR repeat region-containing protein n=1 Tax=Nocardia sp. NPDC004068 TaxID=3364303 RepID=UPI0036B2AFB1